DIDSSFTIGMLEMQRQAILKEIKERDLIRKNAETHLPSVVQRIAVITSDRAAGWKDFAKHIEENLYGYDLTLDVYEAAMQGQQVETEILAAFRLIEKNIHHYDAVCVIRGGGGRTDLAAFDNLALAVRIAKFPIPVLIGIGHEIDQSVLDLVAYRSLKTPTAVADFLIEHNADFENRLDELNRWIRDEVADRVLSEKQKLNDLEQFLKQVIYSRIRLEEKRIDHIVSMLRHSGKNIVSLHAKRLEFMHALLSAIDPDKVLARGYTITTSNGKAVGSAKSLDEGARIETIFQDGTVKSIVE
ncbi:MAG: exodeoxyribonuclease VII large subunit, partial [Saprospiraceae bacterium]